MKKLLVLSLLASFAQAHCNAEIPAQEQSNIVHLTKEEREICKKYLNTTNRFLAFESRPIPSIEGMLTFGCGLANRFMSSYDANTYPDCRKVLDFVLEYTKQKDALREEARTLFRQAYNKANPRAVKILTQTEIEHTENPAILLKLIEAERAELRKEQEEAELSKEEAEKNQN